MGTDGPRAGALGRTLAGAFTAGLLHDVGRMAMAAQQPERYARVIAQVRSGEDVLLSERHPYPAGVFWDDALFHYAHLEGDGLKMCLAPWAARKIEAHKS